MVSAMAVGLLGTAVYASAQPKEFVIGYVIPETGRSAKYGESHKRGAEMALEEINAAGGVNGIKLKVVYGDGKCAPVEAANATERLIVRDKVDVLMGETCSGATLGMLKVIAEQKFPLVNASSTAPAITACDAPTKGYVFRMLPTNDLLAAQLAQHILDDRKLRRVAVITDVSLDWSVTLRDAFLRELRQRQIEPLANEGVQGRETDFYSVLQNVKAKKPDATFMNIQIDQGIPMFRQAHEIGFQSQFFSAQGIATAEMEKNAGKEAEGTIALAFYHPDNPDTQSKQFTANFAKRYPGLHADHYDVQAYDGIYVIADALKRADGDKAKLRQALASTKGLKGVLATTTFDACGQSSAKLMLVQFRGGRMVPLK
jgi:branched-chain amino acid transport system substrate-binding protein